MQVVRIPWSLYSVLLCGLVIVFFIAKFNDRVDHTLFSSSLMFIENHVYSNELVLIRELATRTKN